MFRRLLAPLVAVAALITYCTSAVRADGLIVVANPPATVRGHFSFAPLEVTYHKVECEINGQVAVTSVDQDFYNPNSAQLEGEYIFPIPLNAQINKFAMDIDGKTVEAELLPAEKARTIYNEIVRKAKDPALLEYAGRAMFKVHIFPIEPNSHKRIQLKYTELLRMDNGLLDYHYTLSTEKFSSKPLQNVSVKVSVMGGDPITTIYSPTHEVDIVRHGDTSATAGFESKNIRPDTDFHLFIGRKAAAVGISLLTYRPDPTKEGYFVLLASPTLSKEVKAMPKDVVFVMDTSGSMAGDKIEQVRKALKYCIDTLNPDDRFDIIRFSTEAEPFFKAPQPATAENRKKASEFVAGLRAAGGTAIDDALAAALAEAQTRVAGQERVSLIVFMTDGQPTVGETNPDNILKRAKDLAKGTPIRIFSFGVGTNVNTKLLDMVADQSRGYAQYVLPNENLEVSMSSFWGKVQDPVLANLKLDSGSIAFSKVYPHDLPDLFKGDQLVAFGTYEKPGKGAVTITGMVGGQMQKFAQDVAFEEQTDTSREWIARLWATRRVGYLLDEIRLHGENAELKDEIVDLARRWGVVTPYTAMLIIEDERRRNVPLAARSMREMEYDTAAAGRSSVGIDTLRARQTMGTQAVANSLNTRDYNDAKTLTDTEHLAEQTKTRNQFEMQAGAAMAKGSSAPSAAQANAPLAPSGSGFAGGYGGRGSRGAGGGGGGGRGRPGTSFGGQLDLNADAAATPAMPTVTKTDLNLGTSTDSGWQGGALRGQTEAAGYRVITNYAQQSRVINNHSFFLNGNQWTETRVQELKEPKRVKIVFNSDEYFALIAKFPDAAQYLSLGNNITLELGGTVYDIVEETAVVQPK